MVGAMGKGWMTFEVSGPRPKRQRASLPPPATPGPPKRSGSGRRDLVYLRLAARPLGDLTRATSGVLAAVRPLRASRTESGRPKGKATCSCFSRPCIPPAIRPLVSPGAPYRGLLRTGSSALGVTLHTSGSVGSGERRDLPPTRPRDLGDWPAGIQFPTHRGVRVERRVVGFSTGAGEALGEALTVEAGLASDLGVWRPEAALLALL